MTTSTFETRDEWLAARRDGICGSDVPIILGVSPWGTIEEVIAAKLHGATLADNAAMRRGRWFESGVVEGYAETTGNVVEPPPARYWLVVGDEPWQRCSPDRFAVDAATKERGGMEAKTCKSAKGWGPSGFVGTVLEADAAEAVPAYYLAQVGWSLAVTGLPWWDVAAFFMFSDDFRTYRIKRDPGAAADMVARCREWWRGLEAMR